MPFGSGLSGQFMTAAETTVGTAVTPTTTYEILSETFAFNPTYLEGQGLKAGVALPRASRSITSRVDVNGGMVFEHGDRGHMGLQWKHAVGSATALPSQVVGAAYKQIHTPGIKTGLSQTVQVGRPQTNGTVTPFTYNGVKTTDWSFTCSDNAIAQLSCTTDGWNETTSTALATAAYSSGVQNFTFRDASTFTLGGTASTAASTSEVQTVSITGTATGGTFTLTFSGQTTAAIVYNATAAQVQSALAALPNIGSSGVTVSGGPLPGTAVVVTFAGPLGGTRQPLLTATSSLTGTTPAIAIAETTAGAQGETTIASGVPVASIVRGITLNGTTPMRVDGYGLGNAGVKKEQLENAFQMISGSLDMEFSSLSEVYALFKAYTYTPLELDFVHFDAAGNDANGVAAGPNPYRLAFIMPAVKFKLAQPQLAGPDIVKMKADFTAYDDGSGTNPVLQVKLVSTDTTL